jgi:hypothetical protein
LASQSSPTVVDAEGVAVCYVDQYVGHPGEYDAKEDKIAQWIVNAVNNSGDASEPIMDNET